MCFSPYLSILCEVRGGPPMGLVHNLLVQFFAVGSSKMDVYEAYFLLTC